jgi:hypothetical protein
MARFDCMKPFFQRRIDLLTESDFRPLAPCERVELECLNCLLGATRRVYNAPTMRTLWAIYNELRQYE